MKAPQSISFTINKKTTGKVQNWLEGNVVALLIITLAVISFLSFDYFYQNGVGLAYNDARSHLDIGRRVVEGLKPGLAQIGSVWLPLPHFLMIPTVWNDLFWHSGLSGAIQSMASFVITGILIYSYLKKLNVSLFGRLFAVFIFVSNLNILYLQSTAMTELLLLATMTGGAYYLMLWFKDHRLLDLLKSSFWIMLSTLVRYDGWFLLLFAMGLIFYSVFAKKGYKEAKGTVILFATLGGFGIFLWFLWNILIFGDPLYFVFGPFSAHAQQNQIFEAGELFTKGNLWLSIKSYVYALFYNTYTIAAYLGLFGAVLFWKSKKLAKPVKIASLALIAPFIFNVLALYSGHSILFVKGVMVDTWFNVRYGILLMPAVAIFIGYLVDRLKDLRWLIAGVFVFVSLFSVLGKDAVTIDDALIGSSGKNVAEVSGWLKENVTDKEGFILISVASHDAIIFSSGLPMKRFIHEGTGAYWEAATKHPDIWATWIIMRTNDLNDLTFKEIKDTHGFKSYTLVDSYPFADIYELKPEFRKIVQKKPY